MIVNRLLGSALAGLGILAIVHSAADCVISDWLPASMLNNPGYSPVFSSHITGAAGVMAFIVGMCLYGAKK